MNQDWWDEFDAAWTPEGEKLLGELFELDNQERAREKGDREETEEVDEVE